MKLIVGFGNPESKYNFTRHNYGFLALDFYAKLKNLNWEKSPKFDALWLKNTTRKEPAIFIKPQTYYNEVGRSIQAFAHFYKITPKDILVICDDFNLDFGKIRYREKGSDGGNNGLKSTIRELSSSDFPRLRLGTDSPLRIGHSSSTKNSSLARNDSVAKNNPTAKISDIDFVLSKFTPDEKAKLPEILKATAAEIDKFLS